MADNLESYFKKHLSDDTPGEDNWNVPSDDVWDNVLPEIQKKRGLFIPLKYLYLIGFFILVGLVGFFMVRDNKSNQGIAEQNISDLNEIIIDESTTQNNSADNTAINENYKNTTPTENKKPVEEIITENQIPDNKKEITAETLPAQIESGSIVTQKSSYNNSSSKNEFFITNENSRQTQDLSPQPLLALSITNISDSLDNNLAVSGFQYVPPLETDNKKVPFNNKGKVGIGAFFAPTFTSTFVKGDIQEGLMQTSGMFLYSSNWGFELRYYLSKGLSIVSGVEKSQIRSWSKSLVDFDYDPSTEHDMGNGQKENTSAVPMPTPYGEIGTDVTYRFPGSVDIPEGDPMQSAMETHLDVTYLSIPLGVEYNIIQFSQFNWIAEGGLRFNHAMRDSGEFTSRILHYGDDMDVVEETMTSHPTYTENYLNFYIGTGVNYQLSKSILFSGSARYSGNITEVNLQDNMSTYVHGISMKFGILYLF